MYILIDLNSAFIAQCFGLARSVEIIMESYKNPRETTTLSFTSFTQVVFNLGVHKTG